MRREAFISYLDEKDNTVEGFFEIITLDQFLIRFKTGSNIITMPVARILKIKERIKEDDQDFGIQKERDS